MIGDLSNMMLRLRSVLPARWFGDNTPILNAVLGALATAWASLYALLLYARAQTRIATSSDIWLNIIANDFFGSALVRQQGEEDGTFRSRIISEIVRERCTRAAVLRVLSQLTGNAPKIFEPANCGDTGAYSGASAQAASNMGYGVAGGWGNLRLPFQFFVTACRPSNNGGGSLPGWNTCVAGYGCAAYAGPGMIASRVTDTQICDAVLSVLPVSVTAWIRVID